MQPQQRKKIEQTIAMLQEMLGQKSGSSSGPEKLNIPGLDEEISNFTNLSSKLEPEIQELTKALHGSFNAMQNIINYSTVCKAPNESEKKEIIEKFQVYLKKAEDLKNNPKFGFHAQTIFQLIPATLWVLSDKPEYQIQGGVEGADFYALKFQQNKNQGHNAWYRSIKKATKLIEQFSRQYKQGLTFNKQGVVSWSEAFSGSASESSAKKAQEPQKTQVQTTPTQSQPKPQAPKVPKMQLQGLIWLIANYKNEKIVFPPGKLEMKQGIYVQNCHQCTIEINEKFKSLKMSQSNDIVLQVKSCVSGLQIMNCMNLQLVVKGQTPSISVDKSERVKITLNEQFINTDIVSSKSSELNIFYQKGDQISNAYFVGEQLITSWNPTSKKFETKIYDKFM